MQWKYRCVGQQGPEGPERQEPEWTRDLLLSLSHMLRQRTTLPHDDPEYLNPVSFGGYFKPIKKLFDMNDVIIPWKRIYATYPELDNVSESRGWSRDEIQHMLKHVDGPMDCAIILVSTSSGIRAGGFDLSWRDLTPICSSPEGLCMDESNDTSMACAMLCVSVHVPRRFIPKLQPNA